jgi:hypothetical protein
MKQDRTIAEYPQIGLARPEEFYAVRMGLIECRADGRHDLPFEVFKMRKRKTIPLIWIAAPSDSDMEVVVFGAAALKLARKARLRT